ncbi:MarR family winged helix-turn-helix transcriptional regulator [Mycobacterium decipiens]|uniref:Transcriptional regulator n=1 Tax=Mycobacterium decipiens TaxID=1430326 RepID=A0A1X2LMI9_9MYCO|nr:MarR family transcriptional regulator [Mycobacterium decipiens]OSC35697.1 transcriptional regulator [Mycobacterium decipiens]
MIDGPGFRSPQTDLGQALRIAWWSYLLRLDTEMESVGFPERRYAMNYVFALYAQPRPMTISEMGRQFDVSRQAASKIVAELRDRGYVHTAASTTDQREKVVELTPKAIDYVTARLSAAAELDREIRARIGDDGLGELYRALDAVGEVCRGTTEFDPANPYRAPKLW